MSKVITANALATGIVVFYGPAGTWVTSIDDAAAYDDNATAEAGLLEARQDEARALVIDAFIVDRFVDGKPKMTLRDTIRAFGPTIEYLPTDHARHGATVD